MTLMQAVTSPMLPSISFLARALDAWCGEKLWHELRAQWGCAETMGENFLNINKTRNSNDLILEKVNLECTKRAFFFYKG